MKTLCAGAAMALMAGLSVGGAMKPQLITDTGLAGPRTLITRAGVRAVHPDDGAVDAGLSYANYAGEIPAYVTGTDAQAPAAIAVEPAPPAADEAAANYYVSPLRDEAPAPRAATGELTPAAYGRPETERLAYPSLDGGADYDAARQAQATPVVETAGEPGAAR